MNDKSRQILFLNFLESLRQNDATLIESIKQGFNIMYENSNAKQYTEEYNYLVCAMKIGYENNIEIIGQ